MRAATTSAWVVGRIGEFLVFISGAAKDPGPIFAPEEEHSVVRGKPAPKAATHGPLTQSNFLLPMGSSLPPCPIHHSRLSGHCQKPAEGQWQPRVPIHPRRKGPVCVE